VLKEILDFDLIFTFAILFCVMQNKQITTKSFFSDQPLQIDSTAGLAIASFFFIILLIFALFVYAVNKFLSRPKGLIIPIFEAPKGFSPAGAGFVLNGWIDERICMASIMNMKEKGFLLITKVEERYVLKKIQKDYSNLSEEEICLAKSLFKNNDSYFLVDISREWDTTADPVLSHGIQLYKASIKKNYNKYITSTHTAFYFSLFITFLAMCFTSLTMKVDFAIFFMLTFASLFLYSFIYGIFAYIKEKKVGYFFNFFLFIVFSILPFMYFQGHFLELNPMMSLPFFIIIGMFMINSFLFRLPFLYVGKNRKIRNELEGLKRYLTIAESERYKILDNPDAPLEVKEKLLPYAIAFGVENEWTKRLQGQFVDVLFSENSKE
jgi:hypothetical protein